MTLPAQPGIVGAGATTIFAVALGASLIIRTATRHPTDPTGG